MSISDQPKSKFFSGRGTADVLSASRTAASSAVEATPHLKFHQAFAVTAAKEPDLIHSHCIWVENLCYHYRARGRKGYSWCDCHDSWMSHGFRGGKSWPCPPRLHVCLCFLRWKVGLLSVLHLELQIWGQTFPWPFQLELEFWDRGARLQWGVCSPNSNHFWRGEQDGCSDYLNWVGSDTRSTWKLFQRGMFLGFVMMITLSWE